jgi:predicted dehydrogenase
MRILMIGLGGIGQRHLRNIRAIFQENVEVLACRFRNRPEALTDTLQIEPGSKLEDKYGIKTVFSDLDQALSAKPDAAFICNPSSLHVPTALACARAGCHLFIEKPLSHSLDGVEELIELTEAEKRVGYVGYQMRFHPCFRRVHELLRVNAIGQVLAVRAEVGEYLPAWHTYEDYRQMYASRNDLGGGVILSQIHEMDYLYWLFGLPRQVFALGGHLSSLEVDVEDVASILMSFVVNEQPMPVHLHQDYVQRPPSRTLQIVGDSGTIRANFHTLTVEHFDGSGQLAETTTIPKFERNQLFLDELVHFFACIEGKEKPLVSLRDGAQSLRMALAAKESLETGKVIQLS